MSIFIDEDLKEIHLSVTDLVTEGEKISIGFSGSEGYQRLWVGQALHTRYLEEQIYKNEDFQKEVTIKHQFEVQGWKVYLQGRIDGIKRQDGKIFLQEIKTLHFIRDLPQFYDSETFKIYKKQTEVYSYLLNIKEGKTVAGYIVLLDIETMEEKIIECPFSPERVESFILNRLRRIIRNFEIEKEKKALQREFSKQISFIYSKYRPYQKEMMSEIDEALRKKFHILISAPTGLGKTVSAITPSIKFCLEKDLKLFFLTSKTLQQDMAVDTIKKINSSGVFHSIQIRAKEKMCPSNAPLCHERFCIYARDYGKKKQQSQIIQKILQNFSHIDPDVLFNLAKKEEVCPFEISLELLSYAKFVICDYNYIFDPYISFFDFKEETSLSNIVLIIDEAHNLVERGRGYWSPEMEREKILEAQEKLLSCPLEAGEILLSALNLLMEYFDKLKEEYYEDGERIIDIDKKIIREAMEIMESQILDYFSYLKNQEVLPEEDKLMDAFFSLSKFARVLEFFSSKFKIIYKKRKEKETLKIFCLDPAPFLGKIISRTYSTIAMSATLTPPYFYKRILGFPPEKTIEASFPSPFPKENRKILIYPELDTTYKKRMEQAPELAEILHEIGNSVSGNFLILFPSYEYMKEVLKFYNFEGKEVLVQEREQNLKESKGIISKIKRKKKDHLLFAVSGGQFAEGVDYPEEIFKGVLIVSPSLPQVSLEQELLKEYYQEEEEDGFSYAYVIPGITRVIQSAGRVIRSEKDRGVVVLICKRFKEKTYNRFFPEYWFEKSPEELITKSPVEEIKKFFGGKYGKKKTLHNR